MNRSGGKTLPWPENLLARIDAGAVPAPYRADASDLLPSLDYVLGLLRTRKNPKWHESLLLYFRDGMVLSEIAQVQGVTTERVRQWINLALAYLRHPDRKRYLDKGVSQVVQDTGHDALKRGYRKARTEYDFSVKAAYVRGWTDTLVGGPSREDTVPDELSAAFAVMATPLETISLKARSLNACLMAGYRTVGHLLHRTDAELMAMRNAGKETVTDIRNVLSALPGVANVPYDLWCIYMRQDPARKKKR